MNAHCDFELMMIDGIVWGYAADLAEAWLVGDEAETQRIRDHVEGNYGLTALNHVAELAVVMAANGGAR